MLRATSFRGCRLARRVLSVESFAPTMMPCRRAASALFSTSQSQSHAPLSNTTMSMTTTTVSTTAMRLPATTSLHRTLSTDAAGAATATAPAPAPTEASIDAQLRKALDITNLTVADTSGGCGSFFSITGRLSVECRQRVFLFAFVIYACTTSSLRACYHHTYKCAHRSYHHCIVSFVSNFDHHLSLHTVAATEFESKMTPAQHRLVTAALAEEIPLVHGVTIKTIKPSKMKDTDFPSSA
jgi:stress-induced morphogen